jgi:hypothetical protein
LSPVAAGNQVLLWSPSTTKDKEPAMAEGLKNSITVAGFDIGKNSFWAGCRCLLSTG